MRWVVLFLSLYLLSQVSSAEKYEHLTKKFEDLFPSCLTRECDNADSALSYLSITLSPLLLATGSVLGTTDITGNAIHEAVNAAKPDAVAYIAVDGKNYHTAKLELAFQNLKIHYPNATNMQLAKAIAAY